jgi:hypothetical protein
MEYARSNAKIAEREGRILFVINFTCFHDLPGSLACLLLFKQPGMT